MLLKLNSSFYTKRAGEIYPWLLANPSSNILLIDHRECWLYLVLLVDVNSLRHEILDDIFVSLSGSPVDGAVTSVVDKALRRHEWTLSNKIHTHKWPSLFDVFLSLVMLTSKKIYQNSEFVYFLYYLHFLVKFLHQIQIYWAAIQCRHTWNCLCCSFNFKQSSIISKLSSVMNSKLYLHSLLWSAIV